MTSKRYAEHAGSRPATRHATARQIPTEHAEQVRVINWFSMAYRQHRGALIAIPNAGKRSHQTAARMRAEGLLAGVLDLNLRLPSGQHAGLWLELKRRDATRADVTDDQYADIGYLLRNGYAATWAAGADEAIRIITAYLSQPVPTAGSAC